MTARLPRGLAAAVAALLFALPVKDRGLSVGDEGHLLAIASRLAHGEGVLYRDIATNIPPLCYETLALAFRLFGETLQTERWLGILVVALAARASFLLGEALGGPAGGWAATGAFLGVKGIALPHWNLFYYTETSLMLSLWALSAVARPPLTTGLLLRAGTLLALAIGFKQSFGAFAMLAAIAAVAREPPPRGRGRDLLVLLAPSLLLGIGLLAWLLWHGALGAAWRWNVVYFLRAFGHDLHVPYPAMWGDLWPGKPHEIALFYYLPSWFVGEPALFGHAAAHPLAAKVIVRLVYILPLAAAILLVPLRRSPVTVFAVVSLVSLRPLADFSHFIEALTPSAIVLAAAAFAPGPSWRPRVAQASVLALLAVGTFSTALCFSRQRSLIAFPDRGHAWVRPHEARELAQAHAALHRHAEAGEPILALPYCPLFYFTGRYRNPTALYLPFPSFLAAEESRILAEAASVQVVIRGGGQWPHLRPLPESAPRLTGWLASEFHRVDAGGGYEILAHGAPERLARAQPGGQPTCPESRSVPTTISTSTNAP